MPGCQLALARLGHAQRVLGRLQRVLLLLHLQLRHAAAAGHGEQPRIFVGLVPGGVARARRFVDVDARFLLLGLLALRQLAGAIGEAALVLARFDGGRFAQRAGAAFHQRALFGKFFPLALGVVQFQPRFEGVLGRFDRAARVDPRDDVATGHRLAFGNVDVGQFAVDRRIQPPHVGRRRQAAAGGDEHVGVAEERPDQRGQHQRDHRIDQRLGEAPRVGGKDRNALGAVVLERFGERLEWLKERLVHAALPFWPAPACARR